MKINDEYNILKNKKDIEKNTIIINKNDKIDKNDLLMEGNLSKYNYNNGLSTHFLILKI